MEIVDLTDAYVDTYCRCLEDWSDEMLEAGDRKRLWYERAKGRGLRVKLAIDDEGRAVGMIHYAPIEDSPALGEGLYYVYCVWVHGYKRGVGNFQGRGVGSRLLAAAEEDAKALGARGLVAWGLTLPFFMRSKWFKRRGYVRADADGALELVWKPFVDGAEPPRLPRRRKKPDDAPGEVVVTCVESGWCPAQNLACERARRAVADAGGAARLVELDGYDRATMLEWGAGDALFIDDAQVVTGPPPSYASIRKKLERRIRKKKPRAARTGSG
ncbi:MAG: GNAT family N-acetyltransferase [Spirochaetaceae bacterium]|nr:GNAT family N-acetyltransferase [Spirochaetaceae bacterium]